MLPAETRSAVSARREAVGVEPAVGLVGRLRRPAETGHPLFGVDGVLRGTELRGAVHVHRMRQDVALKGGSNLSYGHSVPIGFITLSTMLIVSTLRISLWIFWNSAEKSRKN